MQKVEVSRGLLIGLVSTAVAAVIGLVFLLGRESGRGARVQDSPAPVIPSQVTTIRTPDPVGALPKGEQPPLPFPVQGVATAGRAPVGAPVDSASEAMRAAVVAYFDAIDHIQPGGMSGDPQSAAQGIMGSLSKGDSSGFEGMIQQAEAARARLAAILPPPPCVAYHRESLASLDDGLALMRSLRTAMAPQGADGQLSSLVVQAEALRKRSEALQREEQALRRRYGVAAKP